MSYYSGEYKIIDERLFYTGYGTPKSLSGYTPNGSIVGLEIDGPQGGRKREEKKFKKDNKRYNKILDLVTDPTLRKVMERMKPANNKYNPASVCDHCGYAFPCDDFRFIEKDLKRRIATDPLIAEGVPAVVAEGAL